MWMFIRANVILLMLLCVIVINISARGCPKRSRDKIRSSGYEWAGIAAPSSLTATAFSYSEIRLSWQDNSNNEDGFEIWRSLDGINWGTSPITTTNANTTSYSDPGPFLPFTTYYYRVRAYNTIGDRSAYSNVASAITIRPEWGAMAAGESHSLALNTNSTLWSWGNNQQGQLGLGDASPLTVTNPTLLGQDTDWSIIAAGYNHTLAIKSNNTLWSWGDDSFGQLGIGTTDWAPRAEPVPVGTDSDWLAVSPTGTNLSSVGGGEAHTIALKTNQTLWSWGDNTYGQLGLGSSAITPLAVAPTQLGTDSDWLPQGIASGGRHNSAIKTNRTLWAWGWNYWYQLGDGSNISRTTPRSIGTDSDWSMVSAGYIQTVALKTTGTLWHWGYTEYEPGYTTPTQIGADADWAQITASGADPGSFYSLAMKINGSLWAWGMNTYGQLGLGDNSTRTSPIQIGIASDWVAVVAGGWHTIALTSDRTLWVWGRNNLYQLGLGNTINQIIPINTNMPQPGNLIATVISYTQITLSWIDNSSIETSFIIERSISPTTGYSILATVGANPAGAWTSYPDETVTRGSTYYYRVKASYGEIDSAYSNVAGGVIILWFDRTPVTNSPLARYDHSMVWDTVGQIVIMFGGYDGTDKNDLWWYDPASGTTGAWIKKIDQDAVGSPSARRGHSMIWDPIGQRVIMFGGIGTTPTYKNDLWWYEPVSNTWIEKIAQGAGSSPSARQKHSMVWSASGGGQMVIMFGGYDASGRKNDLWWYDPVSGTSGAWIKKIDQDAVGSPSARGYHSMVCDSVGQRVIMFGGHDGANKNDLWWYDPVSGTSGAWIKKIDQGAIGSPSARGYHSMAWDSVGQKLIMFGGFDALVGYKNDLWWYEPVGNTWTHQTTANSPSARRSHFMVWDSVGQRVIMFGGDDVATGYKNDLWWWW